MYHIPQIAQPYITQNPAGNRRQEEPAQGQGYDQLNGQWPPHRAMARPNTMN